MRKPLRKPLRKRMPAAARPASRAIAGDGGGFVAAAFARPTLAGPAINHRTALSIAAVYAAVQCYVNTIGALDLYVAERDERGGRRPAYDHPAYDLLHSRPNGYSTSIRFRQALVGHALTHGNGYAEITWDGRARKPTGLHLMDPRDVEPELVGGRRLQYRFKSGDRPPLPAEDVFHLAMFGWDGIKGYSPIHIAAETLGVAAAQRTYQAGLFGNSAAAQGHLEIPGKLTSKARGDLRDDWNRVHQGADNAGNLGILDGGAKWVQTNFSPQDAQLILGCNFSVAEIARIFNLPQHKLNLLDHATFSNVEEMNLDFYQTSILPWLVAIEQEGDAKLFGPIERASYFVQHDVATLLRGNTAAQTAQETADLASGVRSINDVRIARGLDPIDHPNADKHWIPVNNLQALEDLGQAAPPPPAAALDPAAASAQDPTRKRPEEAVDRAIEDLAGAKP